MNDVGDYTRARDLLMDIQQRERVVGAESASAQDHREGRLQPERSSEDASIHRAGPSPAVASRRPVRIRGQACAVAGRNPLRGRSEQAARGSARLSVTRQPRAIVTEGSLSDLSLSLRRRSEIERGCGDRGAPDRSGTSSQEVAACRVANHGPSRDA